MKFLEIVIPDYISRDSVRDFVNEIKEKIIKAGITHLDINEEQEYMYMPLMTKDETTEEISCEEIFRLNLSTRTIETERDRIKGKGN